jgi:hypothetical protein
MNAGTFSNNPQENTIPPWLLACAYEQSRCHCNARFKPNILCIKGHPYNNAPPSNPSNNLTIQFIEFTYCNDRFSQETIANKIRKYQPLLDSITILGWKVDPLIVITVGARGTTHVPSMKLLETNFEIPETNIRHTFKEINTVAIQHAGSIILHKRKIENNQPLPLDQ